MLKENLINKVFIFKLSSGEELVSSIKEENEDFYILKDPFIIQPMMGSPERNVSQPNITIAFIPFMFGRKNKSSVKIFKRSIMCMAEPEDEMKKKYIENTTNISIATKIPPLG